MWRSFSIPRKEKFVEPKISVRKIIRNLMHAHGIVGSSFADIPDDKQIERVCIAAYHANDQQELKERIFELEEELHDRTVLSIDGFAACNPEEPSKGDLERIYAAYQKCFDERNSLKRRNETLLNKIDAYKQLVQINAGKAAAYKTLGDNLVRSIKKVSSAISEYDKLSEWKDSAEN